MYLSVLMLVIVVDLYGSWKCKKKNPIIPDSRHKFIKCIRLTWNNTIFLQTHNISL
jgi:hypothetical protein